MGHVVIVTTMKILPPPVATALANPESFGEMTATVTYAPPDTMSDTQIGNRIERIVRRLTKLADD